VSGPPDEMSCRELVDVITEYLEGTMDPFDRVRFEAHLDECPYCVK
jgi:predicted anti-sigma-YlaC factor YlaD